MGGKTLNILLIAAGIILLVIVIFYFKKKSDERGAAVAAKAGRDALLSQAIALKQSQINAQAAKDADKLHATDIVGLAGQIFG